MNPDQLDRLYSGGLESLGAKPEEEAAVVVRGTEDGDSVRCVATDIGLAVFEGSIRKEEPVPGYALIRIASASIRITPWRQVSATVRSTFDRDEEKMVVAIDFEHPVVDVSTSHPDGVAALAKSLLRHLGASGRNG